MINNDIGFKKVAIYHATGMGRARKGNVDEGPSATGPWKKEGIFSERPDEGLEGDEPGELAGVGDGEG
jgi:hypothetical protein